MPILAFAVLLTFGSDISLTEPSDETLKGAWRLGHTRREDLPALFAESRKTALPRRTLEMETIVVEWRSPLLEAYRKGHAWTLEETKYDFKSFLKDTRPLTGRLAFDITVRALPDAGYRSPSDEKVEGIEQTSCTLLLGGKRFDPVGDPKFVSSWDKGSITEGGLAYGYKVGRDVQGIYVEPASEFVHHRSSFSFAEAKTRVEFDPRSGFDGKLDDLIKGDFAIEVELQGRRHRLQFTAKGREEFRKLVAKNVR